MSMMDFKVKPSPTLRGLLLDTNVFNHIVMGKISSEQLPTDFSIFVTHIQHDEISNFNPKTAEEKLRKEKLLALLKDIPDHMLLTQTTVMGISRWGQSKWGHGKVYNQILNALNESKPKRKEANIRDALIGEVAIEVGLELVTNDGDLKKIVIALGGYVVDLVLASHEGS